MLTYEQKKRMSTYELEETLREIISHYDWGTFFKKVQPVWIDFRKPEKPLVFLMPQIPCPCGGTFFINVHFVAMPNPDHQKDCPFRESADTRRHFFQVLIKAQRDGQSGLLLYFANFRIPTVKFGWSTEINIPIAIVDDRDHGGCRR
jgi:hypothetical protein